MADNPNSNSKSPKQPFTLDNTKSGVSEMPSVSALLNRKKYEAANKNKSPFPTPPDFPNSENEKDLPPIEADTTASLPIPAPDLGPTSPIENTRSGAVEDNAAPNHVEEISGIHLTEEPVPPGPAAATSAIRIQPATRRARKNPVESLALWEPETLKNETDPLGKGLFLMIERGVKGALFLATISPPPGCPVPHFVSSAAMKPEQKLSIWTGLKWDPTVVPDTWNYFIKAGFIELTPPDTNSNQKSNRNVVRAAFGVQQNEWLLLVRVGPANACRGVLALISEKSILKELADALPLFTSTVEKAA